MKKYLIMIFLLAITSLLFACHRNSEEYDIYASIYPIEYLAKRIVGEHLKVGSSYPRGADVHEYEPPANQIVKMSRSKVLFYIGVGLEGFLSGAKNTIFEKSGCELVELSKYVELLNFADINHASDHDHIADPHIWLDPIRMVTLARVISDKVIAIDPDNKEDYLENTENVVNDLLELDAKYNDLLNLKVYSTKTILVDHDAYIYWEERYGITRIKTRIENHSCEIIPSEFNKNLAIIEELNIKYIIITKNESTCPVVGQYVSQAKVEVESIHSLATITKKEEESGYDYLEIMNINLSILTKVLPKRGD